RPPRPDRCAPRGCHTRRILPASPAVPGAAVAKPDRHQTGTGPSANLPVAAGSPRQVHQQVDGGREDGRAEQVGQQGVPEHGGAKLRTAAPTPTAIAATTTTCTDDRTGRRSTPPPCPSSAPGSAQSRTPRGGRGLA